jgi:Uma2 family endonuclease
MSRLAPSRIRFTVKEYLRMDRAGIFGDKKVELIDGRVRKMHAQANPHRWAISKISRLLINGTSSKDWVVIEGTFFIDEFNAPEPDFHLFDVPEGTPDAKLPLPILVIEVSNHTYKRDSGSKLRMYARAGIPDYWIVNLKEKRLEVYRNPHNPTGNDADWTYASSTHLTADQRVSVLKRPSMEFGVDAMLP